jgi:hypothetical protein
LCSNVVLIEFSIRLIAAYDLVSALYDPFY